MNETATSPRAKRRNKSKGNIVTALDIGTSKICCFIARADEGEPPRVIGIGHHISHGMKAGNIINIEDVQAAINATLDNAEEVAGEKVSRVVVNFSGGKCSARHIDIDITLNGREASDNDIVKALAQGEERGLDDATALLHLHSTDFSIDGQSGIRDPRGMAGDVLTARMHMITAQNAPIRTLMTSLQRCHLQVANVVVSPYASGLACLVPDEKELGAIVIDMGGGTTTLAVFTEGNLVHADSIPLGGMHVTNDVARVLTTPLSHAERLKTLHGSAIASAADEKEIIEVPQVGEEAPEHANHIPKSHLNRIIQPRLEETFEHVRARLQEAALGTSIGRRVVLTGGACQLPGVRDLAQRMLDKQVRIGRALNLQGISESASGPAFATTAGLVAFAANPEANMPRFGQDLSAAEGPFAKFMGWLKGAV